MAADDTVQSLATRAAVAFTAYRGESIGLIDEVRPAADIVADMAAEASRILKRANDSADGK